MIRKNINYNRKFKFLSFFYCHSSISMQQLRMFQMKFLQRLKNKKTHTYFSKMIYLIYPKLRPVNKKQSDLIEYTMASYNAANLAKYQKAPMFIIESLYDQFSVDEIVATQCKSDQAPYNLDKCNQTARSAIEDYRKATIQAIKRIKGDRNDVGAWSPSCVQHGFVDMDSYTDPRFKVPSVGGPMLYQAIAEFFANPQQAKMYIDAVSWPYNTACNGQIKKQLSVQ